MVLVQGYIFAQDTFKKQLLFGLCINALRQEKWETISDSDAVNLCSVNTTWCDILSPEIREHRDQKITAFYEWMAANATNPFSHIACPAWGPVAPHFATFSNHYSCSKSCCKCDGNAVPMLALYENNTIKTVWHNDFSYNVHSLPLKSIFNDLALSYIISGSLVVGPSGNMAYGFQTPREIASSGTPYLQRVRFKLQPDGSVQAADIEKIADACDELTIGTGGGFSLTCITDKDKKRSLATMVKYSNNNLANLIMLVRWAAQKGSSCTQTISNCDIDINGRPFIEPYVAQETFNSHSIARPFRLFFKKGPSLNRYRDQSSFVYRFEHATGKHNFYDHVFAVGTENGVGDVIPVQSLDWGLQKCLLSFPITQTEGDHKDISGPFTRVIHSLIPNANFSKQFCEMYARFIKHAIQLDVEKSVHTYVNDECSFEDALVYTQTWYYLSSYNNIVQRCMMRKSQNATLYCDAYGSPYYCPEKGIKPMYLDYDRKYSVFSPIDEFMRRLVPVGPLPRYLKAVPDELQDITGVQVANCYIRQAEKYAQQTWDNGKIGACWEFEENNGMRVYLYDFSLVNNYRVGTYLIPHLFLRDGIKSDITDVEYVPGQEPIFWIDGERVDQ